MQNQTQQGGDHSESVTIDSIFDDPTEGDAGEGTEQAVAPEAEEGIDSDTSEGEEEQQAATDETAPEETGAPKKLTAETLANEYGLDINNPRDRKIIDRMLEDAKARGISEKRVADGQDYIKKLQEKVSQGDYFAKLERNRFQQDKEKPQQQAAPPPQTQQQGDRSQPQAHKWNDGWDHWQSPKDAQREYAKAWEEGDEEKAANIQLAINNRWYKDAVDPYVRDLIRKEIESRVGPVLQKDHQLQQQQDEEDSRVEALETLKQDSDMAKLLDEMFEHDGSTVDLNGQKVPGNAIWKLLKENPWIMKIKAEGRNPRETFRKTWAERYMTMAQLHMRAKQQSTISTEKGKEIFESGAKTAKDQVEKDRIRQTINKGNSKGKSRPLSDDEKFVAEISATSGTVGISASSLFK